jgi:hypothetical protein
MYLVIVNYVLLCTMTTASKGLKFSDLWCILLCGVHTQPLGDLEQVREDGVRRVHSPLSATDPETQQAGTTPTDYSSPKHEMIMNRLSLIDHHSLLPPYRYVLRDKL